MAGISYDPAAVPRSADDELGECVEAGVRLVVGSVGPGRAADPASAVQPVESLARRLGFDLETLVASVAVSPPCGLAGTTPAEAAARLARVIATARALRDDIIDGG